MKNIWSKIKTVMYDEDLFEKGNSVLIAAQVEPDMIIALSGNRYFYVDDVCQEFINDEVAELYSDETPEEDVLPEHSKITFINEDFDEITDIPATAMVIAYKRVKGNHNYFDLED